MCISMDEALTAVARKHAAIALDMSMESGKVEAE